MVPASIATTPTASIFRSMSFQTTAGCDRRSSIAARGDRLTNLLLSRYATSLVLATANHPRVPSQAIKEAGRHFVDHTPPALPKDRTCPISGTARRATTFSGTHRFPVLPTRVQSFGEIESSLRAPSAPIQKL